MKLKRSEYNSLVDLYGKEYADKVRELKGIKSLWWQFNNETGPHQKLLWTLFKIMCCVVVGVVWGLIPLPIKLAIALIILILIPIL